jgi:hypothetical protein
MSFYLSLRSLERCPGNETNDEGRLWFESYA